jgi:teichuronic acid exporter
MENNISLTSKPNTSIAIAWSSWGQLVIQFLSFFTGIVLARLLMPGDFGIFGAAIIFTTIISVLSGMGVQEVILREKNLENSFLSTVLFLNISAGLILSTATVIFAPLLANLVNVPETSLILRILSINIIITSIAAIPRSLLVRRMEQKLIARAEVFGILLYGFITISGALLGLKYWTFVVGSISSGLVSSTLMWYWSKLRIKPSIDIAILGKITPLSLQIAAGNLLIWSSGLIDNFFVSRYLGVTSLGYYLFAYNLAWMPIRKSGKVFNSVIQSKFAEKFREGENLWVVYLRMIRYIMVLVGLPISILLTSSNELIEVVYGEKWLPSAIILKILLLAAIISILSSNCYSIFAFYKRAHVTIYFSLIKLLSLIILMIWLLSYGTIGISISVLISSLIYFLINQYYMIILLKGDFRGFLKSTWPSFVSIIISTLIGFFVGHLIPASTPVTLRMLVIVGSTLSIYLLIIYYAYPDVYKEIRVRLFFLIEGILGEKYNQIIKKFFLANIYLWRHK